MRLTTPLLWAHVRGEESGRGNKKATPTSKWLRRLRPQINPTLVVGGDVKEMKKRPERGCPESLVGGRGRTYL